MAEPKSCIIEGPEQGRLQIPPQMVKWYMAVRTVGTLKKSRERDVVGAGRPIPELFPAPEHEGWDQP